MQTIQNTQKSSPDSAESPRRKRKLTQQELMALSEADQKRFWSYVPRKGESECWEWTGWRAKFGYGMFDVKACLYGSNSAHRLSWILTNGGIPEGLCVCHKCDNPPCCNPNHLFLGTVSENFRDMISKKRATWFKPDFKSQKGEECHKAKLTEADVLDIRSNTLSSSENAKKYGVLPNYITKIRRRESWKHI